MHSTDGYIDLSGPEKLPNQSLGRDTIDTSAEANADAQGFIHLILEQLRQRIRDTAQKDKVTNGNQHAQNVVIEQPYPRVPTKEEIVYALEVRKNLDDAEKIRAARATQLQLVLALTGTDELLEPDEIDRLVLQAIQTCPNYSATELRAIVQQSDLVRGNEQLQGALITGGRKVTDLKSG